MTPARASVGSAAPANRRILGISALMGTMDESNRLELLQAVADLAPAADTSAPLLRAIVLNMPAMLVIVDPAGTLLWTNQLEHPEVLGRSMFDFMPVADQTDARAALERGVRTGRADRFIGFGVGRRGPRSRYENWIAPIARGDQVIALALISRDVSEEWEPYEALRDREQRLSMVLRAKYDFIVRRKLL